MDGGVHDDDDDHMMDGDVDWRCHVCELADGYEDNPIVYCGTCDLGVHPLCYGNPLIRKIPEDDWICERCKWNAQAEKCILCNQQHGIMKRTTDFRWAHLKCAMWIPECFFRLGESMEPIDCTKIPAKRWGQTCIYCGTNHGVSMECSQHRCSRTFHITCGMKNDIYLEYKENPDGTDIVIACCSLHSRKYGRGSRHTNA